MAAAAAAAAGLAGAGPPVNINTTEDRDQWINMDPNRYMELCEQAYLNGDFSYVQVALKANQLGLASFINERVTSGDRQVTNEQAFQMLQSAQKTNSMVLALTLRNAALERDARRLVERVNELETNSEVQE